LAAGGDEWLTAYSVQFRRRGRISVFITCCVKPREWLGAEEREEILTLPELNLVSAVVQPVSQSLYTFIFAEGYYCSVR
jgi:hypothetical protein